MPPSAKSIWKAASSCSVCLSSVPHRGPFDFQPVKNFDVDVNILYGNIDSIKETPYGTLLIEVSGGRNSIKSALTYLHERKLKMEVIGYVA
jgi:ABC-type methionine transport system ATPase subunit